MSSPEEGPHLIVTAGLAGAAAESMPQQDAEPETADREI